MSWFSEQIRKIFGRKKQDAERDYYLAGRCSKWDKSEVCYFFEPDVDHELRGHYYNAITAWQPTCEACGFHLVEVSQVQAADVSLQGWRATDEPRFGKANIRNKNNASTGIREYCSIELNAARRERGIEQAIAVIAHEFAHVLYLDGDHHSPDRNDIAHSTTYARVISDADRRTMLKSYGRI